MTEVEQPAQNGIDSTEEDENNKTRPADIEADMREMERRKRVDAIMNSRLFREELERIVDSQIREGGASGILQQLSDIVGVPAARVGSVFKSSNCVLPINDIRGVESMGYAKGEKILRCKLAATFRLLDLYGWTQGLGAQITARLNADQELFLVNPFGLLFHEVTASSLNKADMQGNIVEHGTTNFGINTNHYILHSVVHAARPDIRCAIYIACNPVVAISSIKVGLLPLTKDSAVLGEIATHPYTGSLNEPEEREKLIRSLGPISKVLLLNNHGALCCGETVEEAFYAAYHIVQACETQLKLLPVGLDNLVLIPEETRKAIYDASRKAPDGYEHKQDNQQQQQDNKERPIHQKPKWRVGGAEFEALMRMLDNAGFRTGYIYRHPLVKSELPKPRNDVECPPAVSSLGYLLEEEELYRQGIWKKSDLRKGGDRTRWLNSPNVYQKVEVLETGTPDPKKITKWVADGSPTHSTAVKIENALQFVPPGTNPKEFKKLQQQIKDNRRADKISAGPQSHILEGVTWDEANRIKDATVSATGDHVVLMGAASKGIIQRGYQHNATVYKAPYAKNPFDSVTDDELNEYKRTVERKHAHGEYTDTDFSESEALTSSLQTSGAQQKSPVKNAPSQSETEDASEPQVLRIETKQAPKPSQPEVVLSDATNDFLNVERAHSVTSKKPPTGRANENNNNQDSIDENLSNLSNQTLIDTDSDSGHTKADTCFNDQQNDDEEDESNEDLIDYLNPSTSTSKNALNRLSKCPTSKFDIFNLDNIEGGGDTGIYSPVYSEAVGKFKNPFLDSKYSMDLYDSINNPSNSGDSNIYETISCCDINSSNFDFLHFDLESVRDLTYDSVHYASGKCYTCDSSADISKKQLPTYRTYSHYGFNYPSFSCPDHKHIPKLPSKYIPLKKNMSFDELFSSPRFFQVNDERFYDILKRKAYESVIHLKNSGYEIKNQKIRPRLPMPEDSTSDIDINLNKDVLKNDIEDDKLDDILSDFKVYRSRSRSMKLSTINEEDDTEIENSKQEATVLEQPVEEYCGEFHKGKFCEKISEFNFSDESPNFFVSDFSAIGSLSNVVVENLNVLMHTLTIEELQEDKDKEEITEEPMRSPDDNKRKLMTRSERDQRKEEFFELWEDHLSFYGADLEDSQNNVEFSCEDSNREVRKIVDNILKEHAKGPNLLEENDQNARDVSKDNNDFDEKEIYVVQKTIHLYPERSKCVCEHESILEQFDSKESLQRVPSTVLLDSYNESDEELPRANNNLSVEVVGAEKQISNHSNPRDKFEECSLIQIESDEENLNSIEKLILAKLENSDLDRKEGSIFNKIETTIRKKLTPTKLEQMIKEKTHMPLSSTPTITDKSTDSNSFYSLDLSNVKSAVKSSPKSTVENRFHSSSSSIEAQENRKPIHTKRATKNIARSSILQRKHFSPNYNIKSTRQSSILKEDNSKINVEMNILSPKRQKKCSNRKKRDFITENIMNVSMKNRTNVGAIFGINPFGKHKTDSNIQLNIKQHSSDTSQGSVYSFQKTKTQAGSPYFWFSVSPTKTKPNSNGTKKKSLSPKQIDFNMNKRKKSSNKRGSSGSKSINLNLQGFDDAASELYRCETRRDELLDEYSESVTRISQKVDEIVEIQNSIRETNAELRRNMANPPQHHNSNFSISEDDD